MKKPLEPYQKSQRTATLYQRPIPWRKGPWIQTMTGNRFFPQDPRPFDFTCRIDEIAEALAKQPRFNGHTPGVFYGVAEHSVLVSRWAYTIAPRGLKMLAAQRGLFHDTPEAYIGDVAKPIKDLLLNYHPIEAATERAIFAEYDIPPFSQVGGIVKRADLEVLGAESLAFMPNPEWSVIGGYEPANVTLVGYEWREAKALFLATFKELF